MLDFAVYELHYDLKIFFDLFAGSRIAARFESGDVSLLAGRSGVELAYDVLEETGAIRPQKCSPVDYPVDRSEEYWTGWALACYQWETSLRFSEIVRYVPIKDICSLYHPYHEMDIRHFIDKINELYLAAKPDTNLKICRQRLGLSQKELAEASGVSVRTIQQYEQRQKKINKAQSKTLARLAKALYCHIEDLLELVE